MEYLDNPDKDETAQAHPAYWRGKNRGINDVLAIINNIVDGNDNGSGENRHEGIESLRRRLLNHCNSDTCKKSACKK